MQKTTMNLQEIKLVGIATRANNAHIFEKNPETNRIAAIVQKYFHNGLAEKINARKNPGTSFCVYTNYESDANGDYTYFIGEEVNSFDEVDKEFETLIIPVQNYAKFTNEPGPMPDVCINMWQNIWKMNGSDLGGERSYITDFEVYDQRSQDHNNVIFDIYIGIEKTIETWIGDTNIEPLLKAFSKFEKFRINDKTEQERAGIIQAFEYCFELSWKIMKRLLQERGKITNSPRETFRMAALEGFIADPEIWFDFIKKRNLTFHTYHEEEASRVVSICGTFSSEMKAFLQNIGVIL
jgi:nucleotidyltransferase substrate binding protein (TIGR01987 family)